MFKDSVEGFNTVKSGPESHFGDGVVGFGQKLDCLADAIIVEILDESHPGSFLEKPGKMVDAEIGGSGDFMQRNLPGIIIGYIFKDMF